MNLERCIAEGAAEGKEDDLLIDCNGLMVDEAEIGDEPRKVRRETLEQRRGSGEDVGIRMSNATGQRCEASAAVVLLEM